MYWLLFGSLLLFIGGCTAKMEKVNVKHQEEKMSSFFYEKEDINEVISYFIRSLQVSGICVQAREKRVYRFDKITNETYEHIDTKEFIDRLTSLLTKSGKCYFLAKQSEREAEGIFYGTISAIYQKNSRTKDMYYLFRLYLIDTKTGVLLWSYSKDIRKKQTKALLGW